MKIKYLLAVSTAALIASGSAHAADIVHASEPIVSASAFDWDGFYAGGQVGGSWARVEGDIVDGTSVKEKLNGFIGGLYAGYNFDAGNNVIFGADTDFAWGNVRGSFSKDDVEYSVEQKWVGSTRLRAGYAVDRFLPYIAGGVAYGNISGSIRDVDAEESSKKDKTQAGWTLGVGVDYAMTDSIFLRAEYRYTDLGKKVYYISDIDADTRIKYNSDDFRIGVAYKF
ncbi:MAG: outer membrane immunogenic protein [Candidatus Tokpelaia sp. JSC188]|nr:MAG: outer membrane immunogenic protein [Candidatus Tokpelaia sp. JSC188]